MERKGPTETWMSPPSGREQPEAVSRGIKKRKTYIAGDDVVQKGAVENDPGRDEAKAVDVAQTGAAGGLEGAVSGGGRASAELLEGGAAVAEEGGLGAFEVFLAALEGGGVGVGLVAQGVGRGRGREAVRALATGSGVVAACVAAGDDRLVALAVRLAVGADGGSWAFEPFGRGIVVVA